MGTGSFLEHGAALEVLLHIVALQFMALLVELLCEVGLCCPPQLVSTLLPVVQEFDLKQATGVHMVHKVFHLIIVGDRDPMVFALDLVPVQLERKGFDMRVRSVAPQSKEVGLDG